MYCDLTRCLLPAGSLCLCLHVNCDKKNPTNNKQTNKKKHRLYPQCIQRCCSKPPCKSLVKCQHESDGRANGNTTGFLTFNWLRLHFVSAWHFVLSFVKCLCLFSDHQPVPACSSGSPNRCQRSNISSYCLNLFVKLKKKNVCSKNQKSENGGRKKMQWCWFSRQSWMIKTAAALKITLWSNFLNLWFLFFTSEPIFWAYCSTIVKALSAKTKKRFLRGNKTTMTTTTLCPLPLFLCCYASSVWDGYYATTTRTKVTNENDFNWGCSAVCNNIGLHWWKLHFLLRIVFVFTLQLCSFFNANN